MSNSPLVSVTNISPNKTKRTYRNASSTGKISKITIHHTAGVITAASCLAWFSRSSTGASSNYVIGCDGKIGMSVPEDYRSWCSSNGDNDNIAVTIECSNSATGGNWPVSDKTIELCIQLCVDICKRNGIASLNYTGTKSGNLTRHDMFCNKVCPGPYLGGKLPYIAAEVNRRLKGKTHPTIKLGSSGEYVVELQKDLIKLGYNLGSSGADGSYGHATESAVKLFQTNKKLSSNGICDTTTWKAVINSVKAKNLEDGMWLKSTEEDWYYIQNSKVCKGWITSSGKKYYLDAESGIMVTGWNKIDDSWYYFNDSGSMVTGWKKLSDKWYYLDTDGKMKVGWVTLSDGKYYLSDSGSMVTGWRKIDGLWYHFASSGVMDTNKWIKYSEKWYYMKDNGVMAADETLTINGKTYKFDKNGVWVP